MYKSSFVDRWEQTTGSDEVGVGDYFGGLVFVACALKVTDQVIINKFRPAIKDSKKMTDQKIWLIAPELTKIEHTKVELNPSEYNLMIDQSKNAHEIKAICHNLAMQRLNKKVNLKSYCKIIDQFVKRNTYEMYLKKNKVVYYPFDLFETKAENKYLAVAISSILARYYFLLQIESMKKKYQFNFQKGAVDGPTIPNAIKFIEKFGLEELKNVAKIHFKTNEKIKERWENKCKKANII